MPSTKYPTQHMIKADRDDLVSYGLKGCQLQATSWLCESINFVIKKKYQNFINQQLNNFILILDINSNLFNWKYIIIFHCFLL